MDIHGDLLTVQEVSRLLRVSTKTLERLRAAGLGPPSVRIGWRRLLYERSAVAEWLARQQRDEDPPQAA
jgi:excisionase family DNA binding protein